MESTQRHLILGTAGHIDHGKTSLIRRLTGIETDRLPEERKRGITIDLGFAYLDLPGVRLGVVDVPGHEKFVHNMVAGATGIDLALLVVAADDSVMPQTIEHLAILELLGVKAGLVAITKVDLVEPDLLELLREDLRELLAGTFLADAPTLGVSSHTGEGINELRDAIHKVALGYQRPARRQVFRMPIDRVFTIEGHGTVVTGTVSSGTATTGDNVFLMPQQRSVRIRRMQTHQAEAESITAGQRAAVNLAGVKLDEVHRGDELTVEGYLEPAHRLIAELKVLETSPRKIQNRQLVRLHLGTREVTARLILKRPHLTSGETAFVEFRSKQWMLADYGQRFIVRLLSPVVTIGGGRVLDPAVSPHRRIRELDPIGRKLAQTDSLQRLSAFLEDHDVEDLSATALASRLGIDPQTRDSLLEQLAADRTLIRLGGPQGLLLHRTRRDQLEDQILKRCVREIKRRQPSRRLERTTLVQACRRIASPTVLEAMINDMLARGKLVRRGSKIGPPGQTVQLTKQQKRSLDQLLAALSGNDFTPPLLSEIEKQTGIPLKELELLARLACEDDILVRMGDGLYLPLDQADEARRRTVEHLRANGPATVAQLRDVWGVSRKYAVPFCEYFDSVGVTRRKEDLRELGPNADRPLAEAEAPV